MENEKPVFETTLEGLKLLYKGKVRDIYEVDENKLLIVATDRISCFDFVLPTPIPDKGKILTKMSNFWFKYLMDIIENHLLETDIKKFPKELLQYEEMLKDRSVIVKKAKRLDIEAVVRGYLSGSGWKEYREKSSVCGIKLPPGLKESEKLPEIIFTPATKAPDGEHDINITEKETEKIIGKDEFQFIREKSILLYKKASEHAFKKNIIIADTKFEFGLLDGKIILIDEILTPDSSRFWDKDNYEIGRPQDSFDKQFVRDYLENIKWNKQPPVPELPSEIVEKTREKYLEAYNRIVKK